ncbi:MAG TPA: hypothetical protein VH396_07165 [Chitinophagaceae bacterium]
MKKLAILMLASCCIIIHKPCDAQLMKKIKDKVSQATNKVLNTKEPQTSQTNDGSSNGSGPTNKGGAGLKNTPPPDVNQQIADAEQAYQGNKYSDARYSLGQALMSIEIQLGRELLRSLPSDVNGIPKDTAQDKVMSTQWGWGNLTIQRVYYDGKDKQVTVTIGNNGFYAGLVNVYFNSAYVQADANQQNVKQTKLKNYKAIIQYDEHKGYTLIVPIGQSSMIVWECVNFANEDEVMNAAGKFDIDEIKKKLGEK